MATVTGMTASAINALFASQTTAMGLKADLISGKVPDAQLPAYVKDGSLVYNVQAAGAIGDGTTDDTTAIQTLLNSVPVGSTVYFPKSYATTVPITIPPKIRVLGVHGAHLDQLTNPTFKPKSTFTGAAILLLVDQTTGSYSGVSCEQRIENITVDCSNVSSAATLDAIQAQGYVHGVYIDNVGTYKTPDHGLQVVSNGSGVASSWRVNRLHVNTPYGMGITATMTDATWTDCEVIGGAIHGWLVGAAANSVFVACRAEWNANDGFNLNTGTGTGAGSGGPTFLGCTTDRNSHNGVSITSGANGNAPISFTGCSFRRDGAGSTSSGYAGINVNGSTQPIVLTGCRTYPGTNDDGTGNSSPQYGLSATTSNVQINGGVWHANSEGIHDGGTNVRLSRSPNVYERTGLVSAPVDVIRGVQTNGGNAGHLDVPGYLAGIPTPASHGAIAWVGDPLYNDGSTTLATGVVYLAAVYVPKKATAVKLFWSTQTAGSTPTTGQNWIGLYDSTGARVAAVNTDSRVTQSPTLMTETISVALNPGLYWVAWLFNGTSQPSVTRAGTVPNASMVNFNLTASNLRFATNGSGVTTLPSTLTITSNVATFVAPWAAIA